MVDRHLVRGLVRDEIGVWFGADRHLGRSLIAVWFADRRLVRFVIGVDRSFSGSLSLLFVEFFLSVALSLSFARVRKMFEGKMIL